MIEPTVFALRVALGLMWIVAGTAKLKNRSAASQAVVDFNLLPTRVAKGVGILLPWGEIVLGLLLVAGIATPFVAIMSAVLLCIFSGAIAINIVRGNAVSCQCFGSLSKAPLSAWSIARNAVLLALFAVVAFFSPAVTGVESLKAWQAWLQFLVSQKNNFIPVSFLLLAGIAGRELFRNFYHMMKAMAYSQNGPMRGTFEDRMMRRLRSSRFM